MKLQLLPLPRLLPELLPKTLLVGMPLEWGEISEISWLDLPLDPPWRPTWVQMSS